MTDKMKIFLSYHKNTPCYKSEVFQPIHVGAEISKEQIDFAINDNTGDNISCLNPYYCELTGHYWVLKNYIKTSDEDYIGFAHYRRLPDIENISDTDSPSIYGIGYSDSIKFFNDINNKKLTGYCESYDIIIPCSVYLYANTVNPELRSTEPHYNMYDQFKTEHNNDLLDVLKKVIQDDFPEYTDSLDKAFKSKKIHCYNIYIMRKEILKSFLEWEFDILNKISFYINGWEQEKYKRMAGFVGERLINIWLLKNTTLKKGYMPLYMINFETDYINQANQLHSEGKFTEEIEVLRKLLNFSSDKFGINMAIAQLFLEINDREQFENQFLILEELAQSADNFSDLAILSQKTNMDMRTAKLFEQAIKVEPDEKFYASSFLYFATSIKNIELMKSAWDYMQNFELTEQEKTKLEGFKRLYEKVTNAQY